jgi:hypothetical protein
MIIVDNLVVKFYLKLRIGPFSVELPETFLFCFVNTYFWLFILEHGRLLLVQQLVLQRRLEFDALHGLGPRNSLAVVFVAAGARNAIGSHIIKLRSRSSASKRNLAGIPRSFVGQGVSHNCGGA